MEKEETKPDITSLREQVDYLESKIREAELAASQRLEHAAPIRSIYKWKAPERIYAPKGKPWFTSVGLVTVIVVMYAALTGNYMLILALVMLLMLLYALNTFPPNMVEHEITNKGLTVFQKVYTWDKIFQFWVSERSGQYVINIDLAQGNVNRVILLVGSGDAKIIVQEMTKHVDYLNPGATRQDILSRLTEGKHVPLTKFWDVFEESKKLEAKNTSQP